MPRRGDEQPIRRQPSPGVWQWVWSDGSPLSDSELKEAGVRSDNAGTWADDIGHALGWNPTLAGTNAPGASLDTSQADAQRDRLNQFVTAMQQQAATGDGAWQQTFADAVQRSKDSAVALGSSMPGTDYGSAQRGIATAQGGAEARAAGEEDKLRAQSQLDARRQLGDVLGSQAGMDISQAAEQARIESARQLANQAAIDQSGKNREQTEQGISQMFGPMGGGGIAKGGSSQMSKGGEVPGQPKVWGNDSRNDTVDAKLSPKEIVIPLEIAQAPDAPEKAAAFVRAVKAGYNPRSDGAMHFDGGGQVPGGVGVGNSDDIAKNGGYLGYFIEPHVGRTMQYDAMRKQYGGTGAEVDLGAYRQTAGQQDQLASLFSGEAYGNGPSIAKPMLQRSMDDRIGSIHSGSGAVAPSAALQSAAMGGVDAGAAAAGQRADEQASGQKAFANAVLQRRAQELQGASAVQQAGWQKTLADMGLSLQQQAALRGSIAAAGQGAAAFAGAQRGNDIDTGGGDEKGDASSGQTHDDPGSGIDESLGGGDLEGDRAGLAFGGVIGLADGGEVSDDYLEQQGSGVRVPVDGKPATEAEARSVRKRREYEEETGDPYKPHPKKPTAKESAFAAAVRGVGDYVRNAAGKIGMAEGGGVPDAGPGNPTLFPYEPTQPEVVPSGAPDTAGILDVLGHPLDALARYREEQVRPKPVEAPPMPAAVTAAMPKRDIAAGPTSMAASAPGVMGGPPPAGNVAAQDAKLKTPGLMTKEEYGANQKPPAPEAPKAKTGGGTGMPRPSGLAADEAERDAAREAYTAAQAENKAKADAAAAEANAHETAMNERKALVAKTQERMAEARSKFLQAQDEMARIDTSVDPGRFWATRSTGDKVVGILGLVLGALGAGPDGINRAAVMLNQAIDRDLEAQKAEHELRLRKGAARVDAMRSFYSMARETSGDELAAMDLAHSAALNAVLAKGRQMEAATKDPVAKAQLSTALAAIEQGKAKRDMQGWEKAQDRALEREKIDVERQKAAVGAGKDPVALHTAQEITERATLIRKNLEKAQSLIDKAGTFELMGGEQQELEKALNDAATDMAKLKDPNSVARPAEVEQELSSLGFSPGAHTVLPGIGTRNSVAQKLLQNYKKSVDEREAEGLRVRGFGK